MPEHLHEKHFTLEEARRLLPWVKEKLDAMVVWKRECERFGFEVERAHWQEGRRMNGGRPYPPEYVAIVETVGEINAKGIQVKDLDAGLIDFPCLRGDGEEVYLCWRFGEETVEWWHPIPDGFAGRRSVEEL